MAREVYRQVNMRPPALALVQQCNAIIQTYQQKGLKMTLRQLYYQLVTKNVLANSKKSYTSLGGTVSDARLSGRMDWDAIEDRGRQPKRASEFDDVNELMRAALASYRLPRWAGQEYYVELWVEKDALAGVLWSMAYDHHVTLMVNKGYSSQSAMYEAAKRFKAHQDDHRPVLLYLGDMDPSGEDMVRDVTDRLTMFGVDDLEVIKVALTMDQVDEHDPPPNPAKVQDPRAEDYIAKHGTSSWEVDALPPDVLWRVIEDAIRPYVDQEKVDLIKEREERDKVRLRDAASKIVSGD